ncbi:MAG TPA: response regulator transcription factor [Actinomycetota bacterium]
MHILVIEDDPALRTALERALKLEGYAVTLAADGRRGLESMRDVAPDLIVLDLGLPDMDGLGISRSLRAAGDRTPILMLTARAAVSERVEGLDAGADDYVVKPFAIDELFARVRALLRRNQPDEHDGAVSFGGLTLDPRTRIVTRGDRTIELTRTEFSLLELFLRNPGTVLTRDVIFDRVWGYDFGPTSNSLDVYIGYLRRKTEERGEPRLIHTVRGVGYVLRDA